MRTFDQRRERLNTLRREVKLLALDAALPDVPLITLMTVYDQSPTADQVAMVKAEMRKLPAKLLRRLVEEGVRIELVGGENASAHPDFRGQPSAAGWCLGPRVIIAAGRVGRVEENVVLHELAHCVDYILDYPSDGAEWKWIFEIHGSESLKPCQPAESWYERRSAGEFFAGQFSAYFSSDFTLGLLHWRPRQFVERVVNNAIA